MVDVVRFSLPLGPLGQVVGKHVVVPHVLGLMLRRFDLLKRIAEGPDWERYIADAPAVDDAGVRDPEEMGGIQRA